jgi:hypothetical protein
MKFMTTTIKGTAPPCKTGWTIYLAENGGFKFLGRVIAATEADALLKAASKWRADAAQGLIARHNGT